MTWQNNSRSTLLLVACRSHWKRKYNYHHLRYVARMQHFVSSQATLSGNRKQIYGPSEGIGCWGNHQVGKGAKQNAVKLHHVSVTTKMFRTKTTDWLKRGGEGTALYPCPVSCLPTLAWIVQKTFHLHPSVPDNIFPNLNYCELHCALQIDTNNLKNRNRRA